METKDIFEQMAQRYDTPERIRVAQVIAQAIRSELSGAQGAAAMDYGCGTGLVGLHVVDNVGSMLFVDASSQMIACVEAKIKAAHIENASTLCADFVVDRPPDIEVDYILLSQVLLHVKDYASLLKTLAQRLRPAGHLLIADFVKNDRVVSDMVHNGFHQHELEDMLKALGFAFTKSHTFYEGAALFMKQDASLFLLHASK